MKALGAIAVKADHGLWRRMAVAALARLKSLDPIRDQCLDERGDAIV